MGDRLSDSSFDGKKEEATVAMKMDAKTLNQLSSSGKAAQQNRGLKATMNLQYAIEDFEKKRSRARRPRRKRRARTGDEFEKISVPRLLINVEMPLAKRDHIRALL
ncbi:hypothetical protein PDIG_08880 [Penicillium digitatum PHI26]|uniref:Uncharacterized protein n=1 Tax=Penicillium digitatum (strain PHI26 / CECT 20796) TaxID=1170229 RepID=K9GBT5_PEND2|nr:hypothetical protein PDIG_08880 [Penicillium digitatum PHI26]